MRVLDKREKNCTDERNYVFCGIYVNELMGKTVLEPINPYANEKPHN